MALLVIFEQVALRWARPGVVTVHWNQRHILDAREIYPHNTTLWEHHAVYAKLDGIEVNLLAHVGFFIYERYHRPFSFLSVGVCVHLCDHVCDSVCDCV